MKTNSFEGHEKRSYVERKLTDKQILNGIMDTVSPYITLSWVIDDKGEAMARFNIHPQMDDDHFLELDLMNKNEQVVVSSDDIRSFANQLLRWADIAESVIYKYCSENVPKK